MVPRKTWDTEQPEALSIEVKLNFNVHVISNKIYEQHWHIDNSNMGSYTDLFMGEYILKVWNTGRLASTVVEANGNPNK